MEAANAEAQAKLKTKGIDRMVHDSGHPNYNRNVRERIRQIGDDLKDEGLSPETPEYGKRANEMLRELEDKLRQEVRRPGRLTENTVLPAASQSPQAA